MAPALAIFAFAIALSVIMAIAWLIALRTARCGLIDAIWTFAVGVCGVAGALVPFSGTDAFPARQWLVAGLAAIWSLRLGLHIAARSLRDGDDPRYRHLREEWKEDFQRRLFWFLQIQAAAGLVLVVSIIAAARRPAAGLGFGDLLGAVIVLIALSGEMIADQQVSHFSAAPGNKGKVCDVGLWRFSRHPNYFFEWLAWVGYLIIAIDFTGSYLFGWVAFAAPILMYWLLVHVSGIPPLEAHMLRSRGDFFRDYQRRVNAFWPGFPKASLSERER
jgi:steroid 5-alpha reductase family enzyme